MTIDLDAIEFCRDEFNVGSGRCGSILGELYNEQGERVAFIDGFPTGAKLLSESFPQTADGFSGQVVLFSETPFYAVGILVHQGSGGLQLSGVPANRADPLYPGCAISQ